MPTIFEFKVWASGQAFDADGNPLDADGNVITTESSEDDNSTESEESK